MPPDRSAGGQISAMSSAITAPAENPVIANRTRSGQGLRRTIRTGFA